MKNPLLAGILAVAALNSESHSFGLLMLKSAEESRESASASSCKAPWLFPVHCMETARDLFETDPGIMRNSGFTANLDEINISTNFLVGYFWHFQIALSGSLSGSVKDSLMDKREFLLRRILTEGTNFNGNIAYPVAYKNFKSKKASGRLAFLLSNRFGVDILELEGTAINENNAYYEFAPMGKFIADIGEASQISFEARPAYLVYSRRLSKELNTNNPGQNLFENGDGVLFLSAQGILKSQFALIADVGISGNEKVSNQLKSRVSIAFKTK